MLILRPKQLRNPQPSRGEGGGHTYQGHVGECPLIQQDPTYYSRTNVETQRQNQTIPDLRIIHLLY